MLIRKNTKAFKTILEIVSTCQGRADREQLIRLFITKAGSTVKDRISVDAIQGDASLFYEMNYQTVLNSLRSENHQLNESEEIPGLYYFHSASNKRWDETPFEFDEKVKQEFSSLPNLPTVRKKEKSGKVILPTPKPPQKTSPAKREKAEPPKAKMVVVHRSRQPDFKLKKKIEFSNLDKIVSRQPLMNKEQVLTYYNKMSEHILPYLEDRVQWSRTSSLHSKSSLVELTKESLFGDDLESVPDWLETIAPSKKKEDVHPILINDNEHLLLAIEREVFEFHPAHARQKRNESPDYIIIVIDSPDSDISKAVEVAVEAKKILDGLRLPAFVKTDGLVGLHIYIPLDAKANFSQSREAAMYLCKLLKLKVPESVAIEGSDDNTYGKVSVDYSLNEKDQSIIAPYSLVAGESVTIATPLLWEEVNDTLRANAFDVETIFERLKQDGDPFESLYKKKINAAALAQTLKENYNFLF